MSLLTASDLTYMRATEDTAMSISGIVYRVAYATSPLGNQTQSFTAIGTANCDIWPISKNKETEGDSQTISEGEFYISFPYNQDIKVNDIIDIDSKTYQVLFVPVGMSWLTNLRIEAKNYNLEQRVK